MSCKAQSYNKLNYKLNTHADLFILQRDYGNDLSSHQKEDATVLHMIRQHYLLAQ